MISLRVYAVLEQQAACFYPGDIIDRLVRVGQLRALVFADLISPDRDLAGLSQQLAKQQVNSPGDSVIIFRRIDQHFVRIIGQPRYKILSVLTV